MELLKSLFMCYKMCPDMRLLFSHKDFNSATHPALCSSDPWSEFIFLQSQTKFRDISAVRSEYGSHTTTKSLFFLICDRAWEHNQSFAAIPCHGNDS